jgi:NAD-dependent dihydropyrimidine dehydrogenase PreA subunit
MSVARKDLDACIGCRTCEMVCPMDVMWFNEKENKSVIAYPQQCITCGQCWLNCPTDSLTLQSQTMTFVQNGIR